MQVKIFIISLLTSFTVIFVSCDCNRNKHFILPECDIAYNAFDRTYEQILANNRPKVVVLNKMISSKINKEVLFNDVSLLKRQLATLSDFDFIFYFITKPENTSAICDIAEANNLNIVAIVDSCDSLCKLNQVDERLLSTAFIIDNDFVSHPSGIPGVAFSPFNELIKEFLTKQNHR